MVLTYFILVVSAIFESVKPLEEVGPTDAIYLCLDCWILRNFSDTLIFVFLAQTGFPVNGKNWSQIQLISESVFKLGAPFHRIPRLHSC